MLRQDEKTEPDLRWRDAILAGDLDEWHRFVRRYSDLAVETAVRWCDPGCRQPGGCSLKRGGGGYLQRFLEGDCRCDGVGTAYCFILEKLREKLAFYRGERGCRLDTWVRRLLRPQPRAAAVGARPDYGYRQLYADYLRRVEGRIRAPVEILRSDPMLEQVYVLFHHGRDEETVCETLRLSATELEQAVERIGTILRARGPEHYWRFWGHLWVPREIESLTPADSDELLAIDEPTAAGPDPHTGLEAAAVQEAIAGALRRLPALTRHVLWLAFDEGLTAPQIAAELSEHGLATWSPRRVYGVMDRALSEVCRDVASLLAPVAEVELPPRQLKRILDYWSVARFLPPQARARATPWRK